MKNLVGVKKMSENEKLWVDQVKTWQEAAFPWGLVTEILTIRQFTIVEYHPYEIDAALNVFTDKISEKFSYHVDVNGESTNTSYDSLQAALVGAIAYEAEGPNSHAAYYFMKMLSSDTKKGN